MRFLLDTHTLLWYASGSTKLSKAALHAINADQSLTVVSAGSLWEIAIKVSLGKLDLGESVADFWDRHQNNGVQLLPILAPEATLVQALPFHHRDPFDRILVAQAIVYYLPIVSADTQFDHYGVQRIW